MRELSLGEQDACRVKASQKIDSIIQCIKQKASNPREQADLLKREFDGRAMCNIRTLENFYPDEFMSRVQMRDEDTSRDLITCSLTTVFTLEGLRNKMAILVQENDEIRPIWEECRTRVREEQRRFCIGYNVYQNEGNLSGDTKSFVASVLEKLSIRSVPVLGT